MEVTDYPRHQRIHDLIERQVARTPGAIAAVCREQHISYGALDSRANQLARYLVELGIRPQDRIGINLRRSLDMLVALVAALKAGATYVPLDPFYPADRLKHAVEDSQVAVILTQASLRPSVSEFGAPIVAMDEDWAAVSAHSAEPLDLDFSSENLAYIIYTSGSTGTPKGVMVRHRNVMNFFTAMEQHLLVDIPGVWLAVASIAFDISILELLWTLAHGFRIILQEKNEVLPYFSRGTSNDQGEGGYTIPEQIIRHGVTHLQCTPSLARMIVDSPAGKASLGTLQKFLVGGEALPLSLANELHSAGPKELWNMYGPTETTVLSTLERLHPGDRVISIGRPIANTTILVLDENRSPTPAGVAGELYIGGDGVALGYLNRPDLTAERFIETPLLGAGEIVYRTGDLVRYLPDGRLEFLDRLDHQVKIRGHRIELGEVEAVVSQHPGVSGAIVAARDDANQAKTLVAYITKRAEDLSAADLRRYLETKLPSHMVPSSFVFLDAFPLTPNGKIDRNALPRVRLRSGPVIDSPADEIEARLLDIWCYALGLDSIDVNDDYFDLGGDSLTAVRLFVEINLQFDTQLSLGTLLHTPTVRKMAERIRSSGVRGVGSAIVPIQREGSKPPIFCIGPLNGEVLLFRKLALELGTDQPLFGLEPFGLNHSASALLRVDRIAAHYVEQMKAFGDERPYALLGYSFGGLVAVEMTRQLSRSGGFVPPVVLIDAAYLAGCKAGEQFPDRLRRYGFHLKKIAFGPDRVVHLRRRLKERYMRTAYRTSSAVGVPAPNLAKSIVDRQKVAAEEYRAEPYGGRVYLFKAELENEFFNGGPELGWKGILTDLVIQRVPGDHGTINTGNNLKILSKKLKTWLE